VANGSGAPAGSGLRRCLPCGFACSVALLFSSNLGGYARWLLVALCARSNALPFGKGARFATRTLFSSGAYVERLWAFASVVRTGHAV